MPEMLKLSVNGKSLAVPRGSTVAAAVQRVGSSSFRRSVTGEHRGPLCGMGICFECRVMVNGVPHIKSCQLLCSAGMEIATDD